MSVMQNGVSAVLITILPNIDVLISSNPGSLQKPRRENSSGSLALQM